MPVGGVPVSPNRGREATRTAAGIACGLAAGALWGFVFVAPRLLPEFGAVDLAAGRFLVFGAFSVTLLATGRFRVAGVPWRVWRAAILLGLVGNVFYYTAVVAAVRLVGAPLTAVIIGCLPATVAVVGGLRDRRLPLARLALPTVMLTAGIGLLNLPGVGGAPSASSQAWLGLAAAVGALGLWTIYAVANAEWLKRHPDMPSARWSSLTGAGTLVGILALLPAALALDVADFGMAGRTTSELAQFAGVAVVLGVGASWLAGWLWNEASARLPVGLAGQLIASETLFAVGYSFALDGCWPTAIEGTAVLLVVAGVSSAVRAWRSEAGGPAGNSP